MNLPELLVKCLNKVLEMRGQDCFLKVGSVPRIRVGGNVVTLPFNAIREEDTKMMAEHLLNPAQADLLKKNCSVDFAFTLPGTEQRFRGNIFYQQGSYSLVFRCLWKSIPSFEELHVPLALKKVALERSGIILIAG